MRIKMADLDALPERVGVLEQKLDALSVSVDRRFDEVNRRFDEVSEHVVEQRQYTEFAFEDLEQGLERLTLEVSANTHGLTRVERKLDQFIDVYSRPALPRRRRKR